MHGRGCMAGGACVTGGMHSRGGAWQGECMMGACMAGGHAWQGGHAANSTHPTEMFLVQAHIA